MTALLRGTGLTDGFLGSFAFGKPTSVAVSANLVCSTTITATAKRSVGLQATLTDTATFGATLGARVALAATLAASSTFTPRAVARLRATLADNATFSPRFGSGVSLNATLVANTALTAAPRLRLRATLADSATITGTLRTGVALAATLQTRSAIVTSLRPVLRASLATVSTMTVSGGVRRTLSAALSTTAALYPLPRTLIVLNGSGANRSTLTATLRVRAAGSGLLQTRSTLTASLTVRKAQQFVMTNVAAVAAFPQLYVMPTAALKVSASLGGKATARIKATVAGGVTTLTAKGGVRRQLGAALAAASTFTGPLRARFQAAAALLVQSTLAAPLRARVAVSAALQVRSAITVGGLRAIVKPTATLASVSTITAKAVVRRRAGDLVCSSSITGALTVKKKLQLALVPDTGVTLTAAPRARVRANLTAGSVIVARVTARVGLAASLTTISTITVTGKKKVPLRTLIAVANKAGTTAVMLQNIKLRAVMAANSSMHPVAYAAPAVGPLDDRYPERVISIVAAPRSWNVTASSGQVAFRDGRRTG